MENFWVFAQGNDHVGAGFFTHFCCNQFGFHTAHGKSGAFFAGHGHDVIGHFFHHRNPFGIGIFAGVTVIEGINVGQKHQQIGMDQIGHHGREAIVIGKLKLYRGYGIVIIDNGHHTHTQQRFKGTRSRVFSFVVFDVLFGQKNLGYFLVIFIEEVFINLDQRSLAHRGCRLFKPDFCWALIKAQSGRADAHGARRNEDHFFALVFQIGQNPGQLFQTAQIDAAVGIGDGGCADFDNNTFMMF